MDRVAELAVYMDQARESALNYFISHNVPETEAKEYTQQLDGMLLQHYDCQQLYNLFIDQNYNETDTQSHFHDRSIDNKTTIEDSKVVGCYNCRSIYSSAKIKTYIEHDDDRHTALCAICNTNTVIPFQKYYYRDKKLFKAGLVEDRHKQIIIDMYDCWIDPDRGHDFLR